MKLKLIISSSMFDSYITITDTVGTRQFKAYDIGDEIELETFGNEITLNVTPQPINAKAALDDESTNGIKERLAVNAVHKLTNIANDFILRVSCKYKLTELCEGDVIMISPQQYATGSLDGGVILDLQPIIYGYFEVMHHGLRLMPTDTVALNRKSVLKTARLAALDELILYPIKMIHARSLTKNGKIFKTIRKFNALPESTRQEILNKRFN